jgi:hypothetical protein
MNHEGGWTSGHAREICRISRKHCEELLPCSQRKKLIQLPARKLLGGHVKRKRGRLCLLQCVSVVNLQALASVPRILPVGTHLIVIGRSANSTPLAYALSWKNIDVPHSYLYPYSHMLDHWHRHYSVKQSLENRGLPKTFSRPSQIITMLLPNSNKAANQKTEACHVCRTPNAPRRSNDYFTSAPQRPQSLSQPVLFNFRWPNLRLCWCGILQILV